MIAWPLNLCCTSLARVEKTTSQISIKYGQAVFRGSFFFTPPNERLLYLTAIRLMGRKKTRTVRGSDYSPAIALSGDKDIFIKCDATLQKMILYNPNVYLVNDNVYTKLGLNKSIRSQDIEKKTES